MTTRKKFSRRINYAVLDGLFEAGDVATAKSATRREMSEDVPMTPRDQSPEQLRITNTAHEGDEEEIQEIDAEALGQLPVIEDQAESDDEPAQDDVEEDEEFQHDDDAVDLDDM